MATTPEFKPRTEITPRPPASVQFVDQPADRTNGQLPSAAATITKVTVVIPAYNEEQAIAGVVQHIGQVLTDAGIEHELLVVDDGSADRTAAAAEMTRATVVRHDTNRGYGAALKTGFRCAHHDVVCIMDADGTYPADGLAGLIQEAKDADMVVGARAAGSVNIPMLRKPAKWFLNKLANFMTGRKIPDLNSGMRVIRRDLVLEYIDILPDRFSFTTTITLAGLCDGYRVKYVPIEYGRRVGKSKIKPIDALNFFILILRTMTYFRPLRIFVPISLLLLAIGMGKFVIDLYAILIANIDYARISGTSVLFGLGSLQMLSIGIVADLIAFLRRRRAPLRK
jgi:glycosyltransferase involved in cell wall biosynthesis